MWHMEFLLMYLFLGGVCRGTWGGSEEIIDECLCFFLSQRGSAGKAADLRALSRVARPGDSRSGGRGRGRWLGLAAVPHGPLAPWEPSRWKTPLPPARVSGGPRAKFVPASWLTLSAPLWKLLECVCLCVWFFFFFFSQFLNYFSVFNLSFIFLLSSLSTLFSGIIHQIFMHPLTTCLLAAWFGGKKPHFGIKTDLPWILDLISSI